MRVWIWAAAVGLPLTLAACGSMGGLFGAPKEISADDCRRADWMKVGEIDALRGRPQERLAYYRQSCAGFGVVPDPGGYKRGYAAGLAGYCTDTQAYREGRAGRPLRAGACATPSARRQAAYAHGLEFQKIRKEIRALGDQEAGLAAAGGTSIGDSRTPLYARSEGFNPGSKRRRAELESKLRYYASWPPPAQ